MDCGGVLVPSCKDLETQQIGNLIALNDLSISPADLGRQVLNGAISANALIENFGTGNLRFRGE